MKVRPYMSSDYPAISAWFERRGVAAPPEAILPEVGVVVEDDEKAIACAFMYTDSGRRIGIVEWEATNPDMGSPFKAVRALHHLFGFFEDFARSRGLGMLLSWVAEGRGDGRILANRTWKTCPAVRHLMMAYQLPGKEATCR